MNHLPIFVRIEQQCTVIVGGGAVAARKAELLLSCGASVTFVAPELGKAARALCEARPERVTHTHSVFHPEHLAHARLVIAATDSARINAQVAAAAGALNIPVNVVDDPELSSFILPAIVARDPVVVAVGSQGSSPVLARRLREQLEALLPTRLGALARFAGARRALVRRMLPAGARRAFWERIFSGPVSTQVLRGEEPAAEAEFARELNASRAGRTRVRGEVYLIGAGPGDPDLLTLRALQLLQQCDVILYDRLVSPAVLERARRDAERVCVGKEPGGAHTAQEQIEALMVSYARRGLRVARLKGGDPFIFGRGGEEIQVLIRERIPFTVVPGITAGLAAAAATATPLTQRELAQSVTFATGHFAAHDRHDWQGLARPHQTVVFYMGVARMEYIVSKLLDAGAPRSRPALIVTRASLPDQRCVRGTLAEIAARARAAHIGAPALLIVGEAVASAAESSLAEPTAVSPILDVLRGVA